MHSSHKSSAQSLCACHGEDPKYSYLLGYGQPQRDDQVPRCIRAAFPRHMHSLPCPRNDSQGTTVSLWDHRRALQSVSSCHCSNVFVFLNCLCAAGCGPTSGSQRNILKSKRVPRDEFDYIWSDRSIVYPLLTEISPLPPHLLWNLWDCFLFQCWCWQDWHIHCTGPNSAATGLKGHCWHLCSSARSKASPGSHGSDRGKFWITYDIQQHQLQYVINSLSSSSTAQLLYCEILVNSYWY